MGQQVRLQTQLLQVAQHQLIKIPERLPVLRVALAQTEERSLVRMEVHLQIQELTHPQQQAAAAIQTQIQIREAVPDHPLEIRAQVHKAIQAVVQVAVRLQLIREARVQQTTQPLVTPILHLQEQITREQQAHLVAQEITAVREVALQVAQIEIQVREAALLQARAEAPQQEAVLVVLTDLLVHRAQAHTNLPVAQAHQAEAQALQEQPTQVVLQEEVALHLREQHLPDQDHDDNPKELP